MNQRILYVITKSNFGGAQRYVFELATAAKARGHTVAVACGGNGALTKMLADADIPVFPVPSFERDINFKKEISAMFELARIIRSFNPDVVHLNSSKAGATGACIARILAVPRIVFTTHGWAFLERRSFLWRLLVWLASYITALCAHRIILVSAFERTHAHMPFVSRKYSIIPTALPPIAFTERTRARNILFSNAQQQEHRADLWLVTIAELTPNKNLARAIDAVLEHNRTARQRIFYTLIGDGELHASLAERIASASDRESVHLCGYVENARNLLTAFDAFLLPSLKEGMPYAVLEAGAASLPTIASSVGGIPEIIDNGTSGILIDPQNTTSITAALTTLSTDEERRRALGSALNHRVVHDFALDRMLDATFTTYT